MAKDEEDITPEVVIVENDDPLKMILDELKLLAEYYNLGDVKFKVDFEDLYYPNVFVIKGPEGMDDVRQRQLQALFHSKLNHFCDEHNILKSYESVKIQFI